MNVVLFFFSKCQHHLSTYFLIISVCIYLFIYAKKPNKEKMTNLTSKIDFDARFFLLHRGQLADFFFLFFNEKKLSLLKIKTTQN